jgi:Fe-S cluster assembly protein SufD
MNQTAKTDETYIDRLTTAARQLPNRMSWLDEVREQALTHFLEQGFPTVRREEWKYTNVSAVERQAFMPANQVKNGLTSKDIQAFTFQELPAHRLVFVNGVYASSLSAVDGLPAGVTVMSLVEATARHPDRIEPVLGRLAPVASHPFAALNSAFLNDGAYVHLARGAVVEKPIHFIFVSTDAADSLLVQPRNLLIAEENSQATLIEHYVALGDASYLTNAVTEMQTQANAAVEHYRVQQESLKAYHVGGLYVQQRRDSRFTSHAIDLGALLVRNDLHNRLGEEGAECHLNGLYIANGRQHVDNHTIINHAMPHCTSREFYKGILDGRARAVFNGRVVVHPDAQQSDAEQMNNNLLLSEHAEVDTKPELEIYADDVKCSHGATVGQLDPEALFYLRSRAMDESAARDLLTYAFANDVLSRFRLKPIRLQLERKLTSRLLHGMGIEELELV